MVCTIRQKSIIHGLEMMGLVCGCEQYLQGKKHLSASTVEGIFRLYDSEGKREVFNRNGNLTSWAASIFNNELHQDLESIKLVLSGNCDFNVDAVESGIESIIHLGF